MHQGLPWSFTKGPPKCERKKKLKTKQNLVEFNVEVNWFSRSVKWNWNLRGLRLSYYVERIQVCSGKSLSSTETHKPRERYCAQFLSASGRQSRQILLLLLEENQTALRQWQNQSHSKFDFTWAGIPRTLKQQPACSQLSVMNWCVECKTTPSRLRISWDLSIHWLRIFISGKTNNPECLGLPPLCILPQYLLLKYGFLDVAGGLRPTKFLRAILVFFHLQIWGNPLFPLRKNK